MALPTTVGDREFQKFIETTGGNVAVRSVLADASGSDIAVLEDAAHTSGDPGFQFLAVRNDALDTLAGTDGDYGSLQINAKGALYTDISSVLGSDLSASNPLITKLSNGTNIIAAAYPLDVKIGDGTTQAAVLARTTGLETPADTADALVVYDVGSGGASSTLVATHTSPADGSVAYTSNVTITCTGFPFTVDNTNCTVVYILYKPTGGDWQSPIVQGSNGASITAASNVITVAGAGTPFAASDTYVVGIQYQGKGHTAATDSQRSEEISPLNQQVVEESLVDTTNVGAGPTYYPSSDGMQMLGYKNLSLTGKLIENDAEDNTFTVEATNDEDATAANRDWLQIYGYDSVADANINSVGCNATTKTFAWDFDNLNYKYVRVKFIGGASATNTVICKARRNY